MQPLPILYSFRRCPYAMRARLALRMARQPCELREVILRNKPEALLNVSPKGTVPVLVLPRGKVLTESLDIMLWALHQQDPENWLGLGLTDSARSRQADAPPSVGMLHASQSSIHDSRCTDNLTLQLALITEADQHFKPQLDRYKYPTRFALDSGLPAREAGAQWLHGLEQRLQANPYLFGPQATLADWAIAPFIRQFAHTDNDWFNQQTWPHLHRWLDAFLQSELLASCMEKYPAWVPGHAPVLFKVALA